MRAVLSPEPGWIGGQVAQQQRNARLGTTHKAGCDMAQSGYLSLEDGKWKVRYRIKDEGGKWRWAPVHVLGTKRDFPKRSDAKVAKDEFMATQNKIGFRPATGCTIDDFVEVYFRDIAEGEMYCLDPSTVKTYRGYWRKHLEPLLRGMMMRTFRPCDAEQVMNQIAGKTNNALPHETYKRIKSSFSAIFTHAMRKGLVH
jgi:hypothetical protein